MFQILLLIIYLAFISLGLPDGLLGAAWPTIYTEMNLPVSYAGIISTIIAAGTIVSSLMSDRLTKKFGTSFVTSFSVLLTAIALFGFFISHNFIALCLWGIPYGLGAGSVDASLNNYVALHYKSRHMSWLHCMWGIGASVGPYIMGLALTYTKSWNNGYLYVAIIQCVLTLILFLSTPLWKKKSVEDEKNLNQNTKEDQTKKDENKKPLPLKEVFKIKGVFSVMLCFFGYCALESTTGLWSSSYLVLYKGITPEVAANFASLFYIGITAGRAISGFLTFKLNDDNMIRIGLGFIFVGIVLLMLPLPDYVTLAGLIIIGLGCAPIYPSIIHATPFNFGKDKSQAVIGVEMASAYVGSCAMPPIFGLIANYINVIYFPYYLSIFFVIMLVMHEVLVKKTKDNHEKTTI
jgi:fucose permease